MRVDRHPADRILDGPLGQWAGVVMRMMMVMAVGSVVMGCWRRLAMPPAATVTGVGRGRGLIGGFALAPAAAGGGCSLILRVIVCVAVGVVGHGRGPVLILLPSSLHLPIMGGSTGKRQG
ncbi:hypothetical protein VP06_05620 [Methylobacterium aquaticum]|uniref:Uncharacterized protein n=1 Tax=Methylobacterium aquaticum TaxID=270351 RepID=A0A0J6SYK8_9HYPH|nr:hypothetical protein VP06_05620 [Methylobacterium aquaticum]